MNKLYGIQFKKALEGKRIVQSQETFKIRLFLQRAENSLLTAQHLKEFEPTHEQVIKLHWNYWAITVSYYSMLYATKAALLEKRYEVHDHDAALIALAYLLVPNELEKEDLEILKQSHKIFEEEYVHSFQDAQKESHIARYSAIKTYTERRLEEIFENARKFVAKIILLLED